MEKKKILIKLNVAVYLILCLLAITLFTVGYKIEREALSSILIGISIELSGVVIVFFIAQYFFIWNEENEKRNSRIDRYLTKVEQEEYSTVFITDKSGKYNTEFYTHFNERISSANHDVYITGEGFDGLTEEGKKIADDFIDAHKIALENGVSVVRLQTKSFISDFWNEHLKYLLTNYPNFKLFLSNTTGTKGSLCSIDYSDEMNNVSEFMLSVPRTSGIKDSDLAGLAVFIDNNQRLATDIKDMILSQTKNESFSQFINLKNFDIHMTNNQLYFTFGSNMLEERIKNRCPSARRLENVGIVDDYKLVFNRKGDYEDGGVASIVRSFGEKVYGAIYLLSDEDLKRLDKIESPDGKSYYRDVIIVKTNDGQLLECNTYFSYPQGDFKPTKQYLNWIIKGAENIGLPKEYLLKLKKIETVD